MKCRNCSKEIDEFEIFCDECKKKLRDNSSKKEIEEYEKLIDNREKNDFLEHTKELNTLKNLVVKEEKKDELIEDENEIDSDFADIKTSNKKTIIIIVCIILGLVISSSVLFIIFNNGKEPDEEKIIKVDYQEILNEYGNEISNIVKNYISKNEIIPTWQQISELITYNKHQIICDKKTIYKDGNVYLDSCKIDNKPIKYVYGKLQEEIKEGKKIEIYKLEKSDKNYEYIVKNEKGSVLVGTITCETDDCSFEIGYDKYALIKEKNEFYLYDYLNDSIEFGPFVFSNSSEYKYNLISHENKLYAILFDLNGTNNIYNVDTSKTLKNINGEIYLNDSLTDGILLMHKYGYVIMNNNNILNFVNLRTGNVSFSIKEHIGSFVEDVENNIVYMIVYDSINDYSKFKLINSNGKELFNGEYFKHFKLYNRNLIVGNDTNYYVYDSKLKLKYSSNAFENILAIYNDCVVVINNNHLEIIDFSGSVMATFEDEWNNNYSLNNKLSGYIEKDKLSLVIEDGITGNELEYYYISSTKESGKVEQNNLN